MISLIVTIIVIILLSTMAIGTGANYLKESKNRDKANFISVLSSAVSKRHEDTNVSSLMYPYLGYYISDSEIFETIFAPKIKENVAFEGGIWYIVDTKTAENLGVRDTENYINLIEDGYTGKLTVAVVNYATGDVYLVDANSSELGGFDMSEDQIVTGHTHRFVPAIATCTEPAKCADCGFIKEEALGHLYEDTAEPFPVPGDEQNAHYNKVCIREGCGMPGGYEKHIIEYTPIIVDGVWQHKHESKCLICNYADPNKEDCTLQYSTNSLSDAEKEVSHIVTCRYCEHTEVENHTVGYRRISADEHDVYCTNIKCGHRIRTEYHVDNDNNRICDLCNSDIRSNVQTKLDKITMTNITGTNPQIAKYEDTIQLVMVANTTIIRPDVVIAGQTIASSDITSSDNKTWTATLNLKSYMNIPDGEIEFLINYISDYGNGDGSIARNVTEGNAVIFDGKAPVVDYIEKDDRVNEDE